MISLEEIKKIAYDYNTPGYIFDVDILEERLAAIEDILGGNATVCYAMKANPFLVNCLKDRVEKFEVCSPGEFAICEQEEVELSKIVLSGVNKEEQDIIHAMRLPNADKMVYTVESFEHLTILNKCAGKVFGASKNTDKAGISVLLRVTSGNQFGLNESDIYKIVSNRGKFPYVNFEGIQLYSGTQKNKMSKIEAELDWLSSIAKNCETQYGHRLKEIEYGPGLCINYFGDAQNDYEALKELAELIKPLASEYKITFEMGRYIAATCGMLLTRIADLKYNGEQRYAIVDSGINHINYYGQTMAMKIPVTDFIRMEDGKALSEVWESEALQSEAWFTEGVQPYNICGSLCTVGDVIVKNLPLDNPNIGDMLVFYNLGAYSITEGIYLFLSRKMPVVIQYSKRRGVKVLRETIETWKINSKQ